MMHEYADKTLIWPGATAATHMEPMLYNLREDLFKHIALLVYLKRLIIIFFSMM